MRHTNYLLKPVTIDNAKARDRQEELRALVERGESPAKSVGAITPHPSDEFSINVIGGRAEPMY